jgi:hypothetical protein
MPKQVSEEQKKQIYANEADVLNVALFGMTAKEWREKNPGQEGNMRDYATASHLVCLANLESLNSLLIKEGVSQQERLIKLNKTAISQMKILLDDPRMKRLENT